MLSSIINYFRNTQDVIYAAHIRSFKELKYPQNIVIYDNINDYYTNLSYSYLLKLRIFFSKMI